MYTSEDGSVRSVTSDANAGDAEIVGDIQLDFTIGRHLRPYKVLRRGGKYDLSCYNCHCEPTTYPGLQQLPCVAVVVAKPAVAAEDP